jgi:hypothetical protein
LAIRESVIGGIIMKIKVLLSEGTWDSFKTPQYQSITLDPTQLAQPKIQEVIAKQYGMTVVGDISVGETIFSDVYRVEPEDASKYPTKTLVMKLSKNDKEYQPYQEIKQIRERMLSSNDWDSEGDVKAAKYLPIVYLAESLQTSNDNPEYKSIIIMEPLVSFTGNIQDMPRMLSGDPTRGYKVLVSMLKDEEFLNRLIGQAISDSNESRAIMNKIFTGVTPNISKVAQDDIDSLIRARLGSGRMTRKQLEKPIEFYKDPNKLTIADKEKIQSWRDNYDKDSNEFLANMNIITKQFKRIGYIMCDVLGDSRGVQEFETLIGRLSRSTPVAPVSTQNPYPQNPHTKPEEVVPGAEGFNDALQRLEKYGLSRKDLHGKNYMMREDGQIVVSDPGLFISVKAIKESKNANFKVKTKRNY